MVLILGSTPPEPGTAGEVHRLTAANIQSLGTARVKEGTAHLLIGFAFSLSTCTAKWPGGGNKKNKQAEKQKSNVFTLKLPPAPSLPPPPQKKKNNKLPCEPALQDFGGTKQVAAGRLRQLRGRRAWAEALRGVGALRALCDPLPPGGDSLPGF